MTDSCIAAACRRTKKEGVCFFMMQHEEISLGKGRVPKYDGDLRAFSLRVPEVIHKASGIVIFGRRIKSLVFSTDVSIIRNVNADAVLAVYPFTPQPIITQSILMASEAPVFAGVGGGLTKGQRVTNLAVTTESQGAFGLVLNAPTSNDSIRAVGEAVDLPIVITVASGGGDYGARLDAGADIFNVSCAGKTPEVVREIRSQFPDVPIIATGGKTEESILETIDAGANAITWIPPTSAAVFRTIMDAYREDKAHPHK